MSDLMQTRYIRRRLDSISTELRAARRRATGAEPDDRIDAKGDIEVLERRQRALGERLAEIEKDVDTVWERVGAKFEQDLAILEDDLKRWMDGLDA